MAPMTEGGSGLWLGWVGEFGETEEDTKHRVGSRKVMKSGFSGEILVRWEGGGGETGGMVQKVTTSQAILRE